MSEEYSERYWTSKRTQEDCIRNAIDQVTHSVTNNDNYHYAVSNFRIHILSLERIQKGNGFQQELKKIHQKYYSHIPKSPDPYTQKKMNTLVRRQEDEAIFSLCLNTLENIGLGVGGGTEDFDPCMIEDD